MIGEKIKALIEESRLNVSEVSKKLGTYPANMYKIFQKDSVQSDLLISLAKILDIPIVRFFEDEPELKLIEDEILEKLERMEELGGVLKQCIDLNHRLNEDLKKVESEEKIHKDEIKLVEDFVQTRYGEDDSVFMMSKIHNLIGKIAVIDSFEKQSMLPKEMLSYYKTMLADQEIIDFKIFRKSKEKETHK